MSQSLEIFEKDKLPFLVKDRCSLKHLFFLCNVKRNKIELKNKSCFIKLSVWLCKQITLREIEEKAKQLVVKKKQIKLRCLSRKKTFQRSLIDHTFSVTTIGSAPYPEKISELPGYIVKFENLNTSIITLESQELVSKKGDVLEGNLSMAGVFTVTDLRNPLAPMDAVNLQYLKAALSSLTASSVKALDLKGGVLTGPLFLSGNTISGVADPVAATDVTTLQSVFQILQNVTTTSLNALSLSGGVLSGTIDMADNTITGLPQPSNPSDAVPYQFVQQLFSNAMTFTGAGKPGLPITGGTLIGNLNMGGGFRITNLADPISPKDAVNLQTLTKKLAAIAKSLSIIGSPSTSSLSTGPLDMSQYNITSLADPIEPYDAVNLGTLTNTLFMYLPLSGGTLAGALNLNNNIITGLPLPISLTDAVPLNYLIDTYLPLAGGTVTGALLVSGETTLKGITSHIGAATFSEGIAISEGGLSVTGITAIKGPTTLTGSLTVAEATTLKKGATISRGGLTVTVGGATISSGGLTVSGTTAITGSTSIAGITTVTGELTVSEATTLLGTSEHIGEATFAGGAKISSGGLSVTGITTLANATTIAEGGLTVT
ncbi:hypothetical protein CLAVI_000391, partial [Candidatus Clavichlamydia salmonicola]|nr:hypothetical protein [Candidatus Clavichlamydia salmonicola]